MNTPLPPVRRRWLCPAFPVYRAVSVSVTLVIASLAVASPQFSLIDVWTPANEELDGNLTNGPEPHFVYAIGVTAKDTLLVACEGRTSHDPANPDTGAKYILVKRSTDQGATWGSDIVVEGGDGASWTNPAFVVDGATIYLFYGSSLTGVKTLHYKISTDDGVNWSTPRTDINGLWGASFPNGWVQHGTIGHGIKKLKDPNKGRLVLPFSHRTDVTTPAADAKYGVDLLYLDPSGSWTHAGGTQPPLTQETDGVSTNDVGPNETEIAERANGTLVMIARKRWNTGTYTRSRVTGTSIAGGINWNSWVDADGIIGTKTVDGGFIRYSDTCHLYSFSNNPGSTTRLNMAVKASSDGGVTWGAAKTIYTGPATYSDLARDSLGNIYCIFGRDGNNHNIDLDPANPAARVTVAKFNLEWVTGTVTPTIVVDNGTAGFSTTGTSWSGSSTSVAGFYGSDYITSPAGTATATWTPTITVAGDYEIYIRWTAHTNRPDAVPIEIKHNGGSLTSNVLINQQTEGATWYFLGKFNLTTGTGNSVKLSATDAGYSVADAVMFQKQ